MRLLGDAMKYNPFVFLFTCLLVCTFIAPLVSAEGEGLFGDYVSYKACIQCHKKVTEAWLKTPHADAFATLKEQGEEKQEAVGCVRCHVVAMDEIGGFIDMEITPELANVQCESCHGPGRQHINTLDPADIIKTPGEESCRVCHTKGQDHNFDYSKKSKLVH